MQIKSQLSFLVDILFLSIKMKLPWKITFLCKCANLAGDQINIPPTLASARTQTAHILYYQSMKVKWALNHLWTPFTAGSRIFSTKSMIIHYIYLYYNLSTVAQNKSLNKNIIFHPSLPNKMLFIIALLWISPNTGGFALLR